MVVYLAVTRILCFYQYASTIFHTPIRNQRKQYHYGQKVIIIIRSKGNMVTLQEPSQTPYCVATSFPVYHENKLLLDCKFSKHVKVYFVTQPFHSHGIQNYNCKSEIKYINCIGFGFSYKHSPPLTPQEVFSHDDLVGEQEQRASFKLQGGEYQ